MNTYKGGADMSKNAKEFAGGGKASSVDALNTAPPRYKGGAKDIADPSKAHGSMSEGSQGSTTIVGRKGEPGRKDYACPAPVLGFSPTSDHSYMGHFKGEDVLKKGHNVTKTFVPTAGGAGRVSRKIGRVRIGSGAKRAIKSGNTEVAAARPILAARLGAKSDIRQLRQAGADKSAIQGARQAKRSAVSSVRKSKRSATRAPSLSPSRPNTSY